MYSPLESVCRSSAIPHMHLKWPAPDAILTFPEMDPLLGGQEVLDGSRIPSPDIQGIRARGIAAGLGSDGISAGAVKLRENCPGNP